MVFLALHVSLCNGWLGRYFSPDFLTLTDMVEEELPYEYQLEEIAARVNRYRADGITPESFLTPTFLKYFLMVMEPGVLTDINWNDISGLFV